MVHPTKPPASSVVYGRRLISSAAHSQPFSDAIHTFAVWSWHCRRIFSSCSVSPRSKTSAAFVSVLLIHVTTRKTFCSCFFCDFHPQMILMILVKNQTCCFLLVFRHKENSCFRVNLTWLKSRASGRFRRQTKYRRIRLLLRFCTDMCFFHAGYGRFPHNR